MWVPFRCWLCRLSYAFPDFVQELPDSEEAEEGRVWAERDGPVVLFSGNANIETIRKRPEVREVQEVWCLYDNVHPTPSHGIARQFPCGSGLSGLIYVMTSWESATAQLAERDVEVGLLWSFRQGRDELGAARLAIARLADRVLKGDQSAATELTVELRTLGHPDAKRVERVKVACKL
jgi:hypothetical protein